MNAIDTASAGSAASVYLCAFGKHPGWNDHIDDLGIETERLAQVKRLLYVEGIGANIDAGTWDKLGPGQQLASFGHVLMWRRPGGSGDLILARLWSSSDGKGRTRYPMVVCAQLRGVSLRWALENVLPELERLEAACKATPDAAGVVQIITDARAALRGRAARAETPRAEVMLEPETIADLVSRAELGPERQGLLRVLYQVQREMGAFARDSVLVAGSTKGKAVEARPQQLRVPSCSPAPAGAVNAWTQFMLTLVEPQHPMMLIVPLPSVAAGTDGEPSGGWADIIMGDPGAAQFMCIRATPKGLPLTTEIPYTIDATFAASVDRWAETVTSGARVLAELPPRERKGHAAGASASNASGKARGKAGAARKGLPIALLIGALVIGGIVLAVVAAMMLSGNGGDEPKSPKAEPPSAGPDGAKPSASTGDAKSAGDPPVSPNQAVGPADSTVNKAGVAPGSGDAAAAGAAATFDAAAWRALCEAYRDWMSTFGRRLNEPATIALYAARDNALPPDSTRLSVYLSEDGLHELVQPMVDAGMFSPGLDPGEEHTAGSRVPSELGLDPWGIAGAPRSRDLGSLTRAPGDAVKTPAAAEKIARASTLVNNFRDGITGSSTTGWPAPAFLRAQADALRTLGLTAAADEAASAAKNVGVRGGEDVAAGIDAALIATSKARKIDRELSRCRVIAERGKSMHDDVLASLGAWAESLASAAGNGASLDAVVAALEPVARVAARLEIFLDSEYTGIDAAAFRGSPEYAAMTAKGAKPDAATFDQWVYRARAFPSLDAALDPRRAWEPGPTLEAIAAATKTLEAPPLQSPLDEATRTRVEQAAAEVESVQALPWNVRTRSEVEARTRQADESLKQARVVVDRKLAAARERVGKSDAEVRDALAARERIVASESINAAWRSWRDELLKKYPAEQYQELSKAAADLRESLVKLDEESVPPARLAGPDGEWTAALAASLAKEREAIIAEAIAPLGAAPASTDALARAAEHALAQFEKKLAEANALSAQAASVHAALELGHTLDEPIAPTNTTAAEFLRAHRAQVDAGLLGPLGARLIELDQLSAETDVAKLNRLVLEPTPGRPALALSAWKRLLVLSHPGKGTAAWPASIDDVQQAVRMRESLAVAMSDIPDAARREAIAAEIAQSQSALWLTWADRAGEADVERTLALAPSMSVTPGAMSGLMRYNARLIAARTELAAHSTDEAKCRAAAERFLADVNALPEDVRSREHLVALTGSLKQMLAGEEPKEPAIDPLTLGPGSVVPKASNVNGNGVNSGAGGFVGSTPDDGKTLIFAHSRGFSLRFVRVEPEGDGSTGVFYLGQTELSVGQAASLIAAQAVRDDRRRALARLGDIAEVNQGVRTWSVGGATGAGASFLAPAPAWLPKVSGVSDADLYPSGKRPPAPGEDSPVQQIPPDVALWLTRLAGCRLPTRAEWAVAWSQLGEPMPAENWNIRDQSVAIEDAHIAAIESRYAGAPRPDSGVFIPTGPGREAIRLGSEAQAAGWDDGVLWFANVDAGVKNAVVNGSGAHHLMGNVAEYLLDGIDEPNPATNRLADAEASVRDAASRAGESGGVWVVGQSALLDRREPGVAPAPVSLDDSVDGFADVGLRLAFSAAGSRVAPKPLGERLADALTRARPLTTH